MREIVRLEGKGLTEMDMDLEPATQLQVKSYAFTQES